MVVMDVEDGSVRTGSVRTECLDDKSPPPVKKPEEDKNKIS